MEGFRTLGIAVGENRRRFYKAFPGAEPDEWLMLEDYREMLDYAEWFREKNVNGLMTYSPFGFGYARCQLKK